MTVTSRASRTPIPAAFTADTGGTTIADELFGYRTHLQAENKSRATVSLWTGAARQLHDYLLQGAVLRCSGKVGPGAT